MLWWTAYNPSRDGRGTPISNTRSPKGDRPNNKYLIHARSGRKTKMKLNAILGQQLDEAVYSMMDGRSFTKYDLTFDYSVGALDLEVSERYGNIDKLKDAAKIFRPLEDEIFSHGNDTVKIIFYEDLLSEIKDSHLTTKAPKLSGNDVHRLEKMVICADVRTDKSGKLLITPTMFPHLDPSLGKYAVIYRVSREHLETVLYRNWLTQSEDGMFAGLTKKINMTANRIMNPAADKLKKTLITKVQEFATEIFYNKLSGVICVMSTREAAADAHRIDAKTVIYPAIHAADVATARKNAKVDTAGGAASDSFDAGEHGVLSKIYAMLAGEMAKGKKNLPEWFVNHIERNTKVPMDVKNNDPKYKELIAFEREVTALAKKMVGNMAK